MANNGIYYSSGNSLNFTTNNTTWGTLTSGGTFEMNAVSATTYYNLPPATFTGGTVSGETTFTSGLTVNYIDFDTTPTLNSPTGGTMWFDSVNNSLNYKPLSPFNDVTIQIGQENVIPLYNGTGVQINNGQALNITGSNGTNVAVRLAYGGGEPENLAYQIDGVATHDILPGATGFMTYFGYVRDIDLTGFNEGEDVYISQTIPGDYVHYEDLSYTGRTCQVGHVVVSGVSGVLAVDIINESKISLLPQRLESVLQADIASTGVFDFTGLTRVNSTQVSISPIQGWIVDNATVPTDPQTLYVSYTGSSALTITNVSTSDITFLYLTSGGTIGQSTTFLTEEQRRKNIYLGYVAHPRPGNNILNAVPTPDSILSPMSQLRDMFEPLRLINGGVAPSPNTGLTFNTSAGYIYGLGINFTTDRFTPNSKYVTANSPASFAYRTQTGGTGTTITIIDPLNYDLNGVITPIVGNKATNQRIYINPIGVLRIQYGQTVYNTLAEAIQGLQNESFNTFSTISETGILIGILSVLSNCTDLNDTSRAKFHLVSKFGETVGAAGGGGTTNLQQAYNNSTEPEITINATLDGLSIKNGTGSGDTVTSLIQGLNSGGTVTSFIRADGLFSGSSVSTPSFTANTNGITATTVYATTYQNLPFTATTNYVPKWTSSTGLTNSQIVDDGSQVYIQTPPTHAGTVFNGVKIEVGEGIQILGRAGSIGITDVDLSSWGSGGGEIAIGTGNPLVNSTGSDNIAIGNQSLADNTSGINNVAVGKRTLVANQAGQGNVAIGKDAGVNVTSGSYNVFIGYEAGGGVSTEDNKLYIGNNLGTLIYGEFDNQIVNINGTLSATTYDNLPGSSSANCFTTFFVTNISGCSPVNMLSPLNVKDGLSVTGTSTFINQVNFTGGISASTFSAATYENLPFYNAGLLTNSDQWINNNNGTVTLPSAYAALYNQITYPSVVEVFLISSGTSGTHFPALSNNDTNYIVIDYSGGTPSWNILTDNSTINGETIVLTHIIYRAGNFLHVLDFGNEGIALPNKINDRIVAVDRFGRESGFSLGLSGSGVVTLTSGIAWNGTNRQSLVAVNSQDDIFFQVYHTGGTWTYTTSANTLNNLYYDNGTNPVLATAGKYLVNWYFRGQEINDHLYEVWGNDEYDSVSEAQLSTEPNLPELITSHAFLTGRIIVQVSATTGTVESAFVQVFQPSTVQAHNDLTAIQGGQAGEYYHLTSTQYTNIALKNTNNNFSAGQSFNDGLTATTISATTYLNLPSSSGGVTGGGTTNYIPKFTGSTGIGNSQLRDDGSQVFTNQGYASPLTGNLSINASGTTGIAGRATQYGVYGTISGSTAGASAVYGEAGKGQYGVYGYNIGDTAGEYVGVRGYATEASSAVGGTVYIGGKFYGFNGTGAGYSVQLQDGTEGTNKVLVSQTSDGKANWNTLQGVGITITSAATNTLVFSSPIVTLWKDVTLYSSNVAANTLVASKLIPANTFELGDLLEVTSSFSGNSPNGQSVSVRLYINTNATLTGAQLLGTFTNSTATNQYTGFYRHGFFTAVGSSGNLSILNTALAAATSITNQNTSSTQVTINTTVNQYLIFAIQVNNTIYTHQIRGISAKITR